MERKILFTLVIVYFMTGCSSLDLSASACNSEILNAFTQTYMRGFSDVTETVGDQIAAFARVAVEVEGKNLEGPSWTIDERGEGCVITLSATVNGVKTSLTTFYVDLKTMHAYPDDYTYQMVIQTDFPNGIPINP